MPVATLRQLLEAGVHFGHQTSRWNPKMRDYIFTARNGVHIIDLEQTQKMLDEACDFVREIAARGDKVLFVGTKKQAQDSIRECNEKTGMPYVTHRWMGGMLTNFSVIRRRLEQLVDLRTQQERGDFERMSSKEANDSKDTLETLERDFAGLVGMDRLPGAIFIIDCKKERLAVAEANRLRVPIVAIVDTNCDPDQVAYVIPGNDDAIRSCKLVVVALTEAILEGQRQWKEREALAQKEREAETARAEKAKADEAAAAAAAKAEAAEPVAAAAGEGETNG